jgi:hypothetical protein
MVWVNVTSKGLHNIPGFPEISNDLWRRTADRLRKRKKEFQPAIDGLTRRYTFTGEKRALEARNWLFAEGDEPPAKSIRMGAVSLEDPKQFMISWTRYKNDLQPGADEILGGQLALELTHAETATNAFWPRIAKYGTGYNLIGILRKVTDQRLVELKTLLGGDPVGSRKPLPAPSFWQERLATLQKGGRLFEIDLSVLEDLQPREYNDGNVKLVRYNPATLTLLEMTPEKALAPILVRVWTANALVPAATYVRGVCKDETWLYALQAVKTSVTLYGIWLGHVYHWHLVPAAMVRTMKEATAKKTDHPVRKLLYQHSDYLIEFNYVLLSDPGTTNMYRRIAPPTSLANAEEVLKLEDKFADGRKFADDDPKEELKNNGIVEADFTDKKAWDLFPAAQNLLTIWDICEDYVKAFVANTYPTDAAVAADTELQTWMANAAKPDQGNIRGLPDLKTRTALIGLLTSQLYRLTAHGVSRLQRSTDPWLTFVANFPPCLQRIDLPAADSSLNTRELLKYLPNVRTIADTLVFYYAFAYSKPYTPLIPKKGSDDELDFPGGPADPRNKALIQYRDKLKEFIIDYTAAQHPAGYESHELEPKPWLQWPRNIET